MPLLITGATLIDAVADKPVHDRNLLIEKGRIKAILRQGETAQLPSLERIDARGKYVIPGLMDANVHLLADVRLENLARYRGRYEELIAEAAQVALKSGLTTVFDTWGPRQHLINVRDRIRAGEIPGSRIFCAGNIVGFDGPFSPDFFPKAPEVASAAFVRKVNATWVENVGRHLMWLPPNDVACEVRAYLRKGIDFLKYASNDHFPGAFISFSPAAQAVMVREAHEAGVTAQAHTTSVEGLRIAIEAGCDLIQHANITGPVPIPDSTFELFARHGTSAVVFPLTQKRLEWFLSRADEGTRCMYASLDVNARNLVRSGAPLLMAWDAHLLAPEATSDPLWFWAQPTEDSPHTLGQGHIAWFKAMEEIGCPPMQMLKAATSNIAKAYGKADQLGSIEVGKIADLVILDRDPLLSAENYRTVHAVIKEGAVVDRAVLPLTPLLTAPEERAEEEDCYTSFLSVTRLPRCSCRGH